MTLRKYECDVCGRMESREVPISERSPRLIHCGEYMSQVFGVQTKPNTGILQPYVEENLPGGPVEITTASQRDRLCEEHGVSYDSYKHCNLDHKRRRNMNEATDISFDEVMTTIKKERGEWL